MFSFSKYAGCGNDFVLFDNRAGRFPSHSPQVIASLCHRQRGIGADGVILLENSAKADCRMRIFNADGSEAEMCGNGIRCLMKFLHELGAASSKCTIETMERTLQVELKGDLVSVSMGSPSSMRWNFPIQVGSDTFDMNFLNTGVPHAIMFMKQIDSFDMALWGPRVRSHPMFLPHGTNFNIATPPADGEVAIRTYERGVEGETLACGTGATAAALAAARVYDAPSPVRVRTASNETLEIGFQRDGDQFSQVTLTGPANRIYTGEVDIYGKN